MKTIRRGISGEDVTLLKERLVALGYLEKSTHDSFGSDTERAVREFQKDNNLTADGIVGAKTWAVLLAEGPTEDTTEAKIDAMEKLLKMIVNDYYVFGGQGHELTKSYLDERVERNPEYFTDGRYEWLVEQIDLAKKLGKKIYCADCSGLFWWANETVQLIPGVKDATADTLYKRYCNPIDFDEVRPGDILFRQSGSRMVHMAIVGRDGVYEAAGTAYGVVFRKEVFARDTIDRMTGKTVMLQNWTHAGRLKV